MKKLFTLLTICFAVFAVSAQITDNFESYTAFSVDPTGGFWTFYDGDGGQTYSINGASFENQNYVGAAIVFNPDQVGLSSNYPAHSGSQFIAMFNAVPSTIESGTTTNDWMISGQLTNATSFSFFARELTNQYGNETIRVMYSTTTNDPSAFQLIQQESVSATEWTEFSYNLPAGTKYVAINCVSNDVFAIFIDDVTINATGTSIENVENTTFTVYPNPATTSIKVTGEGNAVISNILGQTVTSATVNGVAEINVSNLESGVYFINMNGVSKKFIKK